MITIGWVYVLVGLLFAAWAVRSALDAGNPKRVRNAAFWGLLAASFLAGDRLGDLGNGLLVLALALIAGTGGLGVSKPATTTGAERDERARRHGNWLFVPALIVSATALTGALWLKTLTVHGTPLLEQKQATVISLAGGALLALLVSAAWLRPRALVPLDEGRRLIDTIGWAAILPQALAALGAVFAFAGVGAAVGELVSAWIPVDSRLAVVVAYTFGMALFTIVMGNGYAAFPIMTAAIGVPLIVKKFGGDPVIMGAIGMLSGFCGTLMTPMAANFNVVPASLLELPDRDSPLNAILRVQIPTALILLLANTTLMYALM